MKWIRRKLRNWIMEDKGNQRSLEAVVDYDYSNINRPECDPTMQFKIYSANGGKVVEFRSYKKVPQNHAMDYDIQMYIIGEDEEFGEAIKRIAVLHLLSHGG